MLLSRRTRTLSVATLFALRGALPAVSASALAVTRCPASVFSSAAAAGAGASTGTGYISYTKGNGEARQVFFYPAPAASDAVIGGDDSTPVSPWHDIPLVCNKSTKTYHFVSEIPKGTRAKMEVNKKLPSNPITQDEKNGKPRYLSAPIPFNYGALPQTWENPFIIDSKLGFPGDNDPIDVVELSTGAIPEGSVTEVKLLGALALIDEGEVDWKVLTIDSASPLARKLSCEADVEAVMPGLIASVKTWFRTYKVADGKPENVFGLGGHVTSPAAAAEVIAEAHAQWKALAGADEAVASRGKGELGLWLGEKDEQKLE